MSRDRAWVVPASLEARRCRRPRRQAPPAQRAIAQNRGGGPDRSRGRQERRVPALRGTLTTIAPRPWRPDDLNEKRRSNLAPHSPVRPVGCTRTRRSVHGGGGSIGGNRKNDGSSMRRLEGTH